MRVLEATRLISTGVLAPEILWGITTMTERVTISLLLGRPDFLPSAANTPHLAWKQLNARQRDLVMRRAPARVRRCLPGYISAVPASGKHHSQKEK
ncbi:MAG: hypothetical protein GX413_02400 [Acetobacter sp.]|nr:hypothetical protein [Acetobacter sp.]